MRICLKVIFCMNLMCLVGCSNGQSIPKNEQADKQPVTSQGVEVEEVDESLLSSKRILNIAHRGASGYAPEHTIYAYEMAEELQGDYLEIDLQMTKDNELIAMHDNNVSRTTNGQGNVSNLTTDEIKVLDAGEWFNEAFPKEAEPVFSEARVLTLDEILDTFGKNVNYYIETKQPDESPGMVKELLSVLDKYGMLDDDVEEGQIIIQSFSEESLLEVQEMEPNLPLIQLISYQQQAEVTNEELKHISTYAVGIGANYHYITKEYVQNVRNAGLLIHPYTVNEKKDMKRLIDWGVTGMFTNYPDRLAEVKRELNK